MRSNLAGPFVATILTRADRSLRWVARQVGCSHVALHSRLHGDVSALSLERLQDAAKVCGASREELETIANLNAVDKRALPLDEQTTPDEVAAARAAIEEARK